MVDTSSAPQFPEAPEPFQCDVSVQGDSATLRIVGELDLATVPILSQHVEQVRQAGCRHVVFDLSDLAFIDSTGLCFLLECYAEGRKDGFTMALVQGPPAVHKVFDLTDTVAHLPFVER